MIKAGNQANHIDDDGCSVLHHASYNPTVSLENLLLLIEYGADVKHVNKYGSNVLMIYLWDKRPVLH